MTNLSIESIDRAHGFSRRDLLIGGSAAVAASMLLRGSPFGGASGLQHLSESSLPRIPVAFVEGSAGAASLAEALIDGAVGVPAAAMRSGASELAGRAFGVSVRGASSAMTIGAGSIFDQIQLDALISSPESGSTIPFYAWTFARRPMPSSSSPSRFGVAPDGGLRVGFSLDTSLAGVAAAGATEAMRAITVFTSRREGDLPKLRPGIYLLGLHPEAWSAPQSLPAADDPAWGGELASVVLSVATR